MKQKKVLTQKDLRGIITECVRKVLSEGSTYQEDYNRWEEAKERLGADGVLDEMYNFLSQDEIQEFLEHLNQYYDLWDDEENTTDEY